MTTMALYCTFFLSLLFPFTTSSQADDNTVTFTVIYDNYSSSEQCLGDWGFSCLIEGKDKTILFDTGTKPEVFKNNLKNLKVNIGDIDLIVISHNHGDHTGGLPIILEQRTDLPLYIPSSVETAFLSRFNKFQGHTIPVTEPVEICKGVFLTGEMGGWIKEQSLLIDTPEGLVVVTGCSHQGIDSIVKKASKMTDENIYMVFGGFHLLNHNSEQIEDIIEIFRENGVQKCGATHCTGDLATRMFKETYGDDFVSIGAGYILQL